MSGMNKLKVGDELIGRAADQWMEIVWERILERTSGSHSKSEVKKFLESLLSEKERRFLLRRLAVVALLRSGKSYKDIGRILWVSPQTISTIKRNFLGKSKQYRSHRSIHPKKQGEPRKLPNDNLAVDFIFGFLSIPVEVFAAFFTKGMGVMGDRDF